MYRYADGSVAASQSEAPAATATVSATSSTSGKMSAKGVSQCVKRISGGSTYMDNCLISWGAITWSMTYRANYRYNSSGSSIYSVRGLTYGGAGSSGNGQVGVIHSLAGKNDRSMAQGHVDQGATVFTGRLACPSTSAERSHDGIIRSTNGCITNRRRQ
ncbi:hypothetical protein [Cryptosporangium arvum]|uniref:hypothetical protein n=1 Tax=Cryptosporangium arvum TaxID=80871 RepID=UPI0005632860|nr:hypothetical protein [Cryptosporangium arvum]